MPKYPCIRKKRNKWYYRLQYKGARIEQGSFDTAEESNQARLDHLQILQRHKLPPTELTVKKLCVKYLEEHAKVYTRYTTFIKNEATCRNHIIPMLGHKKIGKLTPNDMRHFHRYCIENKTPAVAHYTMKTLKKVFNWAVEWELLAANPIKGKLPPEPYTEHPTLTPEQLRLVLRNVPLREKTIIGLGVFAGLRIGEIFGLQWENVNFDDNTIYVKKQYSAGILADLKTRGSKSIIPVWSQLAMVLKLWKLQCGSQTWLFPGKKEDRPMWPERWRQLYWNKIKKEFKLPSDLRFHDLRHSFATILLSLGADKGDVQQLMRHKSIKITMDIYRHLLPKTLNRTLEFFDDLCGDKSGERSSLF
jgi:integrase